MKSKFKFFKGYVGTLDVMDSQTYATASFFNVNDFSHEERLSRINQRIQLDEQLRNEGRMSHEQYMLNRERLMTEERIRRAHIVEHVRGGNQWGEVERIGEEQYRIRLANVTRVTTVNPTPWTKVKIFGTRIKLVLKETWRYEPVGVVFVTLLVSLVTFIGIAKLFGA